MRVFKKILKFINNKRNFIIITVFVLTTLTVLLLKNRKENFLNTESVIESCIPLAKAKIADKSLSDEESTKQATKMCTDIITTVNKYKKNPDTPAYTEKDDECMKREMGNQQNGKFDFKESILITALHCGSQRVEAVSKNMTKLGLDKVIKLENQRKFDKEQIEKSYKTITNMEKQLETEKNKGVFDKMKSYFTKNY